MLAVWLLLCAGFELATLSWQRSIHQEDLEGESRTLINLLSQRVDQHDAHLTSLSALSQVSDRPDQALFLEVAAAIQRFYPRVSAIDLVMLDQSPNAAQPLITTRTGNSAQNAVARAVRQAATESHGELVLLRSPADSARYLLVKRSPNNEKALFGLALEIDVSALLSERSDFWRSPKVSLLLSLPDGTTLKDRKVLTTIDVDSKGIQQARSEESINGVDVDSSRRGDRTERTLIEPPVVSGILSSRTQPLGVTAYFALDLLDLLPLHLSIGGPIALAFLLAMGVVIYQLLLRTRNAELHARLSVNEARISHASRVNSLGEMASGMAHELNQPLTAVLGQSQAGLRLLNRPDVDLQRLAKVLEANVSQAKRASAVLSRLRNWSSRRTHGTTAVSINESVANVVALIDLNATHLSVTVDVQSDPDDPKIKADAVEIEQVVFNLVRNALESLDSPEIQNLLEIQHSGVGNRVGFRGLIRITTDQLNDEVSIVISDNGRGISSDIQDRLFEPFATDKPGGMGLGLALCARIVERYDGRIEITSNDRRGTTAKIVFPALNQ